ncbi:MAG TPA: hypothetical protein DCL15_03325 [Chloroflexi bacterium]|nr:hypothetical protein [Chloroflexota bacterium]HHW87093.1 hypothetical protein [Chloroflexota bacterium]
MSSHNGASAASGRAHVTQRTTTFLPDAPLATWQGWLYALTRAQWLGMTLMHWLLLLLIALASGWLLLELPGGWPISLGWLTVAGALWGLARQTQRQHYTRFRAITMSFPAPAGLSPADKRPLYVTGALSVEAKARTFHTLPGFYRTFATREHVLIGRVQPRRIAALATWPEDEIGLWYAFVAPAQIDAITPGQQQVGLHWLPALAITYRPTPLPDAKRRVPAATTLYLAFPDPDDHNAVLADLLVDARSAPASEQHHD